MMGLVDYDSDEDTSSEVKTSSLAVTSQKSKRNSKRRKTAKIAGFEFLRGSPVLPQSIRDLLERGAADEDDDESWSASSTAVTSREAASSVVGTRSHEITHALLDLLPKPQLIDGGEATLQHAVSTAKDADTKPDNLVAITSEDEEDSEDISDPSANQTSFFSFDDRSECLVPDRSAPDFDCKQVSVAPVQHSDEQAQMWQEVSGEQGECYFWNRVTNETTWDRPSSMTPAFSDDQLHALPKVEQKPPPIVCQPPANGEVSSGKMRRMRERDLERSLESGNLEALAAGQAQVLFQPDVSNWNPHQNGAHFAKKEVMIASVAYDPATGESQTVYKPSKVQKRKHQINSLAYSAAERELELMEKKGNSNKTKSQTQAKYGW
mmetsp:Transcript_82278/g.160544  ORF Transcript_82278/g.160544 Transcript_82278/m.160544 type:complete len:379 (-) Transcript_82278:65-1201(-)